MKRAGIISKVLGRSRKGEPLEVILSFKMKFGEAPHEQLTLVNERRVPLVGSVFENRDRIAREFLRLLVQAGVRRPSRLLASRKPRPTRP